MGQIGKKTAVKHQIDAIRHREKDISDAARISYRGFLAGVSLFSTAQ